MGEQLSIIADLVDAGDDVRTRVVRRGLTDSSLRRYGPAVRSWVHYAKDRGEHPADASTGAVLAWLDHRMRIHTTASQLRVSLAALRFAQSAYCEDEQAVLPYTRGARVRLNAWCADFLKHLRRTAGPKRQAKPLLGAEIVHVVQCARDSVGPQRGVTWARSVRLARRDAALLLVGWWGALRTDDLLRLTWDACIDTPMGIELHLQDSKTGAALVCLARQSEASVCPVAALQEWARSAGAGDTHAVFALSAAQLSRRIAQLCARAGLRGRYTGHSLRAGFATEADAQGVPDRLVLRHARWTNRATHDVYVRAGSAWRDTPTTRVTLRPLQSPPALALPEPVSADAAALAVPGGGEPAFLPRTSVGTAE